MKLLADENIARQIVERLRADGHDVAFVLETNRGNDDEDVLDVAQREGAILLTDDKDFGDLVMFQRRPSAGVILFRLEGMAPLERAELVSTLIREHAAEIGGAFTVVKRDNVRIRRLPA
jgi:predicted nuclease of predicted toxin-antitoxin system